MYVVEMHHKLYGPFEFHADAYAWADNNCDRETTKWPRYLVWSVNTPHPATIPDENAC